MLGPVREDHEDDLAHARATATAEELQRLIVSRGIPGRSNERTGGGRAVRAPSRRRPRDGVETVLLLCAAHRWDRCTAKLIAGTVATGVLDDDALDDLAGRLLWQDRRPVRGGCDHRGPRRSGPTR